MKDIIEAMMKDYDAAEKANDIEQIRRVLATATEYFSALQEGSMQRLIFIKHLARYSLKDMRRAALGLLIAICYVEPETALLALIEQIETIQNEWRESQAPSANLPKPSESK